MVATRKFVLTKEESRASDCEVRWLSGPLLGPASRDASNNFALMLFEVADTIC